MENSKPQYFVFCSSQDEPIVAFVREHLKDIREGWEHLQIAGGDQVHLTITLRRETDQPVRTDQLKKTLHCSRTQGTIAADAQAPQKE